MLKAEDIIDALIEIRDIKKWTNYKIALESELPTSTVSNVFNKKATPQLDTLLAICRGFDIAPYRLFGKNEKYKNLSEEENEIINLWEKLDPKSQAALKNLVCLLKE